MLSVENVSDAPMPPVTHCHQSVLLSRVAAALCAAQTPVLNQGLTALELC